MGPSQPWPTATISEQPALDLSPAAQQVAHTPHLTGWRKVVLNFSPAWFSAIMGTGIVSNLLYNLPYNADWVHWVAVVVFAFNVFLFLLFSIISILRYYLFDGVWNYMLRHPIQSLYLGTIPMGLATIINMICFACVPAWGTSAATLALVLWLIDAVLACGATLGLPFLIMRRNDIQLRDISGAYFLPIVPTIVCSTTGAIVASILPSPTHALWTILFSYVLWGISMSMTFITLVFYFQRLIIHGLPPRELMVSAFIPLGPFGQGAYSIVKLGMDAITVFPATHTIPRVPLAAEILYATGMMVGLILWGAGLVWLFFALASVTRGRFPYNLGWWAFTFPLGVYAMATTLLAKELPSTFFKVAGTLMSLAVVVLWAVVGAETVKRSWTGEIFKAPYVKAWEENRLVMLQRGKGEMSDVDTDVEGGQGDGTP